ncbi:MAG: hypothetical protein IKC72_05670 [Clostridia bacterium]|nr:hypothetical protein [Clostridia bacterium]
MEQIKKGNVLTFRVADGNVIQLEQYDTLPSTLALAREYARNGYPDKYVVFSQKQSVLESTDEKKGKNEVEEGIFMSCILRPSFFPSQSGFLGVLTALSMIDALSAHTDRALGLGWVSDVYCEGRRFASASLEGKIDSYSSYEYLIVSFRILLDDEYFPPRMSDIVRRIFEEDSSSLSLMIAKNVLSKFFTLYPHVRTPEKFMEAYQRKFILRGVRTKHLLPAKSVSCRILGVDAESAKLIVELPRGEIRQISSRSQIVIPEKVRINRNKSTHRA